MNKIEEEDATEIAGFFHLMGDPSRLRIIYLCLDGPVSAGVISAELGLSPSLVSHHLRLLKAARILTSNRQGRNIFYDAADHHIRNMLTDMAVHMREKHELLEKKGR
jgi:DNA-binding transcriptional ArsR family regulator